LNKKFKIVHKFDITGSDMSILPNNSNMAMSQCSRIAAVLAVAYFKNQPLSNYEHFQHYHTMLSLNNDQRIAYHSHYMSMSMLPVIAFDFHNCDQLIADLITAINIRHNKIQWTVFTCDQKLTTSQLSMPYKTNKKDTE